jgi:hypothetical protein
MSGSYILWRIDPLLGETSKQMNTAFAMQQANEQTAVSEQRLGKHVPMERNTHATIEEHRFRCGPRLGVIKKTTGVIQFG